VKLSRSEKRVLSLAYDKDRRISLEMVIALGLKSASVPVSLQRKGLLSRAPLRIAERHLLWKRTPEGENVRKCLLTPAVCDWCGDRAISSSRIAEASTRVYFCGDHRLIAKKSAEKRAPAFEGRNVGNQVFGHQAVKRATREAAAA